MYLCLNEIDKSVVINRTSNKTNDIQESDQTENIHRGSQKQ